MPARHAHLDISASGGPSSNACCVEVQCSTQHGEGVEGGLRTVAGGQQLVAPRRGKWPIRLRLPVAPALVDARWWPDLLGACQRGGCAWTSLARSCPHDLASTQHLRIMRTTLNAWAVETRWHGALLGVSACGGPHDARLAKEGDPGS